jgi:hypothetical protein
MALDLSGAASIPPPPRSSRARKPGPASAGSKPTDERMSDKRKERVEAITGIAQLGSFACIIMKQYPDAGAINMYGPGIATELAKLAEAKEPIAKAVDSLSEVGPYAGLITMLMPFALQIAANHKMLKAESLASYGVKAPEQLEAEVKAMMAKQAMEAMRQQRQAEEEMREMQEQAARWEAEDSQEKAARMSMGAVIQ